MLRHTSALFFHYLPTKPSARRFLPCTARLRRHISNPAPAAAPAPAPAPALSKAATRKARREAPETILRRKLSQCSKSGDLPEALRLYEEARSLLTPLDVYHYNVLLHLCSSFNSLDRGFEIFRRMGEDGVAPDEATFTNVARLAAAKEDPAMAFEMVKQMAEYPDMVPRLRSYGPALFGFCKKNDSEGAYAVEAHMSAAGVAAEEPELAALIKVSSESGRAEKVYEFLHRMRAAVRQVSEDTAEVVEGWFATPAAAEAGVASWDVKEVKKGVVKGGGGWHGIGWLGVGEWNGVKTEVSGEGECRACGERLVSIDIDSKETQEFATSLAALACKREVIDNFSAFQRWLSRHGPFEAVIDGANVGLCHGLGFSFHMLKSVVDGFRERSKSKKFPLVVLHSSRVKGGPADSFKNKQLLESWRNAGALYVTPPGSDDDWYWLYAAVRCKCLLVTNDKMRDHLFQLLGTSFFPRWKEKHQVRFTVSAQAPTFHWPPPYSNVIQESESGSWHIPTVVGDDVEVSRKWFCATRRPISQKLKLSHMFRSG